VSAAEPAQMAIWTRKRRMNEWVPLDHSFPAEECHHIVISLEQLRWHAQCNGLLVVLNSLALQTLDALDRLPPAVLTQHHTRHTGPGQIQ